MSPAFQDASVTLRRSMRKDEERTPYPWVIPGPGSIPFFAKGSFPAPAWGSANQITLCTYSVPDGWEGVLLDVMNLYTDNAGTFVQGSGDIVWSIDIDRPLAAPLATGRWLPDYAQILTQLGDLSEPWPVRGGWRMKQGEIYRYKAYTVANVNTGAPSFVHAALLGWVWPMARSGV